MSQFVIPQIFHNVFHVVCVDVVPFQKSTVTGSFQCKLVNPNHKGATSTSAIIFTKTLGLNISEIRFEHVKALLLLSRNNIRSRTAMLF